MTDGAASSRRAPRPLDGIKVLELARVLAAPFGAQVLADMGAEVVKIERPGVGDDCRIFGPFAKDRNGATTNETPMWLAANRNKKSVTVDLAAPEGQDIVRRLAAQSDVVIENFKVGDLARYGLDYESLKTANPGLIYCSVTGFGQEGPLSHRPGYDPIIQAMCGMMSVTGHPEGHPGAGPVKAAPSVVDVIAGLYASNAVLGAIIERDRNGGEGQYIDLALLDCGFAMMSHFTALQMMTGVDPPRSGNAANSAVPGGLFACADGHVMITPGNEGLYKRFCQAIGRPDLMADARFADNRARIANRQALLDVLGEEFAGWTVAQLDAALSAAGVPVSPVYTISQAVAQPQVQARGAIADVDHPRLGPVRMVASPIRYSRTPIHADIAPPPTLGQHTEEVLAQDLGLDDAEIEALRRSGAV